MPWATLRTQGLRLAVAPIGQGSGSTQEHTAG